MSDGDTHLPDTMRTCAECGSCGAAFDAVHERGQAAPPSCPACASLGEAPPPSPCCEVDSLKGYQLHEALEWGYECSECDTCFSLEVIRPYALGLAVARIVRESPKPLLDFATGSRSPLGQVLSAAGRLKIRRNDDPKNPS